MTILQYTLRRLAYNRPPVRYAAMSQFRRKVTIAVCQMSTTDDRQANLEQGRNLISQCKELGAEMAFLPEGFDSISDRKVPTVNSAETNDGPTISAYRDMAKESNMWLSLGGFKQRNSNPSGPKYNAHIIVNSCGQVVGEYRKMHLFDVDIPGKVRLSERDFTAPGEDIVEPVLSPAGLIGLGICYDLRFPEMSTILYQRGAQILTYPSAFTVPTGKAHWEVLLRARAIENQCYVVAAAQVGQHHPKRASYGHSMIVDPWGKILCEIPEDVGVATAEIDLDMLEQTRISMPVTNHRRTDVYQLVSVPKYTLEIDERENYMFDQFPVPPSCVFYKSHLSFAFTNRKPVLPGHMLVCPLRQVRLTTDMTTEETADLFETVRRVGEALKKDFESQSLTITVQDGAEAGQSVPHVHVHILPRQPGDFTNNDDIYEQLSSHDKTSDGTLIPMDSRLWRSVEVMSEEALRMRKYFTEN